MRSFMGNTAPSARYEGRYGADINGDGSRDLGRLVEGNYRYELQPGQFVGNRCYRATATQQVVETLTTTAALQARTVWIGPALEGQCCSIKADHKSLARQGAKRFVQRILTR
jgi:hypothetical protein